jgi:hypothetical protein
MTETTPSQKEQPPARPDARLRLARAGKQRKRRARAETGGAADLTDDSGRAGGRGGGDFFSMNWLAGAGGAELGGRLRQHRLETTRVGPAFSKNKAAT